MTYNDTKFSSAPALLPLLLFATALYLFFTKRDNKSKRVVVLVLGDIGRSPRMQNHAVSFARAGWDVDLVGFRGAQLFSDVLDLNHKIKVQYLPSTPKILSRGGKLLFLIFGPLKVIFQIFSLFRLLFSIPQPSYILVQNPPSMPTNIVAWLVCFLRSAKLVIDWHNLGHTILALRLSSKHPLVYFLHLYERWFSRLAYAHFCVTDLMRHYLMEQYGLVNVTTLMDRPPERYSPLNEGAQSLFLEKLSETRDVDRNNTKILVTSTSYTADEPLQPLLSALLKYSRTENAALPHILLLITGRGPMQEGYRRLIEKSSFAGKDPDEKCTVKMVWLEPQDYPKLLACADLGISLHTSSSGLDFPMKIVDLYGCGVPVCAIRFAAVGEVVEDGINGIIFDSSEELYQALLNLMSDDSELGRLRMGVGNLNWGSWDDEWNKFAKPVFEGFRS